MLEIPHRADDLKYLNNIEGYHGDIHKLGRLLRHVSATNCLSYLIILISTTESLLLLNRLERFLLSYSQSKWKYCNPGGTATFECEIDCKSLIWLKDNQAFDDDLAGRTTQLSQGNLHILEIADVKLSDAGVYTAHATLADGRVTHCTANLIVQPVDDASRNKPHFTVRLKDTELMEHTFLRFMVKVRGDPNPEITFYKDDQPITYKNTHCTINTEQAESGYYELIIPEVAASDGGLYKCVAVNSFGEDSCEGILKVVDDKKVFEGLSDKKSAEPDFQWIKDGQPFDPQERFKVLFQDQEDSLALVFTHVKPEDAGLYTCVASTSTGKISCSAELTVQGNVNLLFREPEAPKVTAVNKVQETNIGSSAMLETKVTGYPKPEVKWIKGESEVEYSERCKLLYEDDETIALVIKNVTLEDMGEYRAVAQNITGKADDVIKLNVKAAPTFTQKLTDVHTISGKEIKLTVQIEANPKPMVAWYKDGKQVMESEHVKLIEEGNTYTLLISSCSLYDVGSYSIVCKNNISQCSEFCKVDIEGAPIFTRNLMKRVETEEGDSLTFLVKVHGTPMPTVQWFFKGKPVETDMRCKISSDNDTHTLTINAIKNTDAGDYSCQLTNLHGTTTDHGQVYVKTAPTFVKGMGHVMAQEKDTNVGFTVQVASFPKGKVRWFCKETEVKETDSNFAFKEMDDSYTLIIKEVSASSAGMYRCKIENEYGSNESTAELTVLCRPTFKSGLKNVTVNEGDTLTLRIEIEGTPDPELKWYKDGTELTESAHIKITRDKQRVETYELTVNLVKEEDGGEYEVRAVNEMGTAVTKSTVIVQGAQDFRLPQILSPLKDLKVPKGHTSALSLVLSADPIPEIKWRKDGNKIASSDHFIIDTDSENEVYKLKIKGILPEDAGTYTVSAVNDVGEASADSKLKIHMEEPEFTKVLENITVREYAALDLKVRAQGVPKPEIQWSKDGIDLVITEGMTLDTRCEGSVSSHLSIPHFKEEYAGKYKVRAYSLAGHVDTTCYVKLCQLSPSFSKSLGRALEVEEGEPLELRCKVESSPSATVKWFKDGEELPESDRIQLVHGPDGSIKLRIEEATPADCGAYKLVVENALGADSSICAVAVNPSPRAPVFLKKLEDQSVAEGQPLFMQAQVMGFPLPEMKCLLLQILSLETLNSPNVRLRFKDGLPLRNSRAVNFINSPGGLVGLSVEKATSDIAGNYSLTVTNKLGEATSVADVEVILKDRRPEFQGYLSPTTVVEGFPVKLTVKVGGNPPPELIWSKNGTPIDIDGERVKVVEMPDGLVSLIIENASPLDTGLYGVTATNSAGTVTSEAKLDVVDHADDSMPEEAPSFGHAMRDTWAEEGSMAYICVTYLGNPVPEVKWFKNGHEVSSDHRITFTNDGHKIGLQIVPCAMEDMDVYKCKLTNPLGEVEAEAKLTVKKVYHAPVFTQKLRDLEQIIGLDGKMVCHVTGNPRPEISWFKNGKPIFEGNRYKMKREGDNCILYLKDCSPDEDGYYKCVATNRDGKDETEAQFRAVEKLSPKEKGEAPCFLKKIGDQELIQGMTGRFTACISGYPEPEVEWYRNNDKLYPSERIAIEKESTGLLRLSIAHVDPDVDAGKYRVRVYNDHGEDECEASFIFDSLESRRPIGEQFKDFEEFKHTGAPMPLADRPIISRMSDRRLTLSWKPSIPYGPREPVTYQVEMCELPKGDWFTARAGIRSCACEVRNLEPFRDYKFRVRVENKYGISDPSPYAMTYRSKLEPASAGFIPFLAPGIDFRPESSPYFPKDFDIERPPHDGYAQAPRFLRQEHYTQYGVKGHNCNLFWFVYGYPKPKMAYFFNNEPIDMGGRYDCSYTRNGQATLFINKMLDRDVGTYEAVATNEHGEARQRVHLEIAEYPEFVKRPEEMTIVARHGGRLEARVIGVPQPEIKWFKDWQPLASTSRLKMNRIDPDHCNLVINEVIAKDAGLYSITASNVAGAVSCSVMLHVEEKDEHSFQHYGRGHGIKTKTKPISDWYDLGDELGRGTQGVTYHAVERSTGRNFAAKIMHGRGELKSFMHNELETMNQLNHHKIIKIHDAFETLTNVTLIIELAGGGEVLDAITRQPYTNESEVASYIRQLLVALDYLHSQNVAHLGLTPGDLLVSHPGGDDLRLADFGLARRIHPGLLQPLDYGMPEFVSPETVRGEGVDLSSDMWSVGVITYLLLSGISLFRGANDKETLTKVRDWSFAISSLFTNVSVCFHLFQMFSQVREGFWEFEESYWKNLSVEARDFVSKLLVIDVNGRMDVKTALRHPWLNYADRLPPNLHQIPTEKLHNYYNLWKDWYSNASCRTWYRRRPLTGAFNHPSKMVYPPHYIATPLPSPERDINEADLKKPTWVDQLPSKQPLNYDLGVINSESHYQQGPDTYLLQLRDVDFPVRIREYMKVAANRGSGITRFSDDPHLDWRLPVIRERRRFTDVMDEEIDDERKTRINQYGYGDSYTIRRLKHEIGSRLDAHVEAEALIGASREGQPPFMREKPQMTAIESGKPATLSCYAVGDPKPTIQWYKNDMMFGSSNRVKITEDDLGRSIVHFSPADSVDAGIYKVVARNRSGQTVARTRMVLAVVPDAPDSPLSTELSDTQVLLKWKQPKVDGNSAILTYSLQYQQTGGTEWKEVSNNIDHEFYLVNRLKPTTGYIFRLACKNAIGWSEPGIPSQVVRTLEEGAEKIQLSPTMKHAQTLSESGIPQETNIIQKEELDYSIERAPLTWLKQLPTDKFTFVSEMCRGRFSVVVKGLDKTNDRVIVAKLCDYSASGKHHVDAEFDAVKSLRHERIAALLEAYLPFDVNYAVLIFEKLQGADILTYLSSKHEYTEQMVATIITQVLDALQYLHWRNLCHLDLQPDNVVMASVRSLQVKLVDFGSAQRVTKLGNVVKFQGNMEFTAPEVLCQEPAYPQSDIWSVGVLAYVMLSGVSPFLGETAGETRQNINFVRFRFEHLYKELTQEATRFIMLLFKRAPTKRPSAEECQEHRWLLPSEYMIKRRERAVFLGTRIKEFSERYHQTKREQASSIETLTNLVTGKDLKRSDSVVEELISNTQ
ncbi:unnamed protein product [Nesidiocoris tenuis]|uniref:Muscle M-line assembly protein unc-89 n=1 Tax=Nesidiocoris tenuis TaxID=355587 RepID=A0A6H5H7J5_9HEMI|nr:unnamed protein product [Nesidiocoris tenuis]